jgi:hypothetical protein
MLSKEFGGIDARPICLNLSCPAGTSGSVGGTAPDPWESYRLED